MAEITKGNWSYTDPGDDVPDGSTISGGNFVQLQPNTEILVGKTLTITGGNWLNVKPQPEWTITGGLWLQRSHCTHLNPHLIARGLTPCDEICSHVVDTDEVWIDGQLVDTIYHYEDSRL